MSEEDIKIVEQTLKGLMIPDNAIRREAEIKLEELMVNRSVLVYCLSSILLMSQDPKVNVYGAVVLRKILEIKEEEICNPVWKALDDNVREAVKKNTLTALMNTNEKSLKSKIADAVVTICENTYEAEGTWQNLLEYIVNGFKLELNEVNVATIETALYLLSKIFGFVYEEMTQGIDLFVAAFKNYFASNSLEVKTKTVVAITEILCMVRKKDIKKFRGFIFFILETTLQCFERGLKEENNLKHCISALCDLATAEPNLLRKSFGDLFILMGKLIEKKDYADETIRELAFEVIMAIIERKETLISKDTEKLKLFVEVIYKYGLEMEDEITDEWLTPTTESYYDDHYVTEEKLETALNLIDRLNCAIGSKGMLPYLSDIVLQLLAHGGADWRFKYIGFMTISDMVEYVDDIVNLNNILPSIFKETENENPKIRYACLNCIGQISDHLNPQFQNNYHSAVIPVCLARIQSEPCLRVKLQACDALTTYLEGCQDQVALTYTQSILDTCFTIFLKGDEEVPLTLREVILNVIGELVTATEKLFAPFAEKSLNFILQYFSQILKTQTHKSLYGVLLDNITTIGPQCEEVYMKYLPELVNAIIEIQNNIPQSNDPIISHLQNCWEKIIPIIKEKYPEMGTKVIESVIKLVSNAPTMSVSSQPERKFDIKELLTGLNETDISGEKNVTIEKKKISLTTSETEDFIGALELLNKIIENFAEMYLPYVDLTQSKVLPLLAYEVNGDVRVEASNCLPSLLDVIKKHSKDSVESLHKYAKHYVSELVQALEKETDNGVISSFLDNLGAVVENAGLFLMTSEINVLFTKLLTIFDKVEKSRLNLIHHKDVVEDEIIKEKESGLDKINSDDENESDDGVIDDLERDIGEIEEVLVSIADVMGSLFNTHKELTLEIVNKLLHDYLPRYFEEKTSIFEKKMGLFILDDMIEFLGQNLLNNIWMDIAKILLKYSDSKETELRQASCYGLGEFAKHTVKDFNIYITECLNALSRALEINSDGEDEEEWGHARDNAVAALGKIIKFQNQHLDYNEWAPKWVNLLPIRFDYKEGLPQHELLCDILVSNSAVVLGKDNEHFPKVLRILAKIYDTKFSDEKLDKAITGIVNNIKQTPSLHQFVTLAKENCETDILKKLEILFG